MRRRWMAWCLSVIAAMCVAAEDTPAPGTVVRYRDFGAKGDGKTDDWAAIAKAHAYANQHNLPVRAEDDAEYYIGDSEPVIVQTDTDWGRARFTIDDTLPLKKFKSPIFQVASKLKPFKPEGIRSLKKGQTDLGISLPRRCVIAVFNDDVKRYIRYGVNANAGHPQTDIFVADKDGRVDPRTPIIWDFDKITRITAYPIDENTLTIRGGRFTTLANKREGKHSYFGRGLRIERSNTVVDGLEHYVVEGGGIDSWPYTGFINIGDCADVTVKNTTLTGRKLYSYPLPDGGRRTTGTYDISGTRALNVTFVDCRQSNDITDPAYWGIMGTNFCKNIVLDRCRFSRFDAHMGVTNAVVRDSEIGYGGMNAIGFGTFLIENTTSSCRNFINLRSDYGSTWNGDFIIRNCVFKPSSPKIVPNVINGSNRGNHDFGYTCYMPTTIEIDGLKIDTSDQPEKYQDAVFFANMNPSYKSDSYEEKFPYVKTKEINVKNLTTTTGKPLKLSANPHMFREVKISGDGIER